MLVQLSRVWLSCIRGATTTVLQALLEVVGVAVGHVASPLEAVLLEED